MENNIIPGSNSTQGQRPTLTEAIGGYKRKQISDHTILHRKRGPGGLEPITVFRDTKGDTPDSPSPGEIRSSSCVSSLRELIQNEAGGNKEMADRVIDSMNRRNDWERKEGMTVLDFQTAKSRLLKIQACDEWLKTFDLKTELDKACEPHGIKGERRRLQKLVRHEIENAQRSLPISAKHADWLAMAQAAITKVVTTPGIDQLINAVGQAGSHRHLHYSDEDGLRTRAGSSRLDDVSHLAGSLLRTDAWKAFQQEKVSAAERVRLGIDRKYGAGMGELVLEVMRQKHGWKPEHGVEVHELRQMDEIAQARTKSDKLKVGTKARKQWIAEACDACGVEKTYFHEGSPRWNVLQARINYLLRRLPDGSEEADLKRAVQVAVLQGALPANLWIDGESLVLPGKKFRDFDIGDAHRAFAAISGREPGLHSTGLKRKVKVDAFERAVWIAEVCRRCGIDHDKLNQTENLEQVWKAIDAALRTLPANAPTEQKRRATLVAILCVACKAKWPQFSVDKALMRSLFQDQAHARYKHDISRVYASFRLLAGRDMQVIEMTYQDTLTVRDWMCSNHDRICNTVAWQCGIPVKTFEAEEVWQSIAIAVETAPGRRREVEAWRLFERVAEIALIEKLRPLPDDEHGTLRKALLNGDGVYRDIPAGMVYRAAHSHDIASFETALRTQAEQQGKWLDDNLGDMVDMVIRDCPEVDAECLKGVLRARATVTEALDWLPAPDPDAPHETVQAQRERVAQGALISLDLLARARRAEPAEHRYHFQVEMEFEEVMQWLTLPGDTTYKGKLAVAHKLLARMADIGEPMTLASVKRVLQDYQDDAGIGRDRDHRPIDESRKKIEFSSSQADPTRSARGPTDNPPERTESASDDGTLPTAELAFADVGRDDDVWIAPNLSVVLIGPREGDRDGWVVNNLSTVLKTAREVCGDGAFEDEDLARGAVRSGIDRLGGTTTQPQAMRAAVGALIERHLLKEMETLERQGGNATNLGKRKQLETVMHSFFHPGGANTRIPLKTAYHAIYFYARDEDAMLIVEKVVGKALEIERNRHGDLGPEIVPVNLSDQEAEVPSDRAERLSEVDAVGTTGWLNHIVDTTAHACLIALLRGDRDWINASVEQAMRAKKGADGAPRGLKRYIQGCVISRDVQNQMKTQGLVAGEEFGKLCDSLFQPGGPLRKGVSVQTAHAIMCNLVDERNVTIDGFSKALAPLALKKARNLERNGKVEAARLWMESEIRRFNEGSAGATAQGGPSIVMHPPGESPISSFMSEREDMTMRARIGRAAFLHECQAHFWQRPSQALGVVAASATTQDTLPEEAFDKALKVLLNEDVPLSFANLLLAVRSEIEAAEFAPDQLQDRFDQMLMQKAVISPFKEHISGLVSPGAEEEAATQRLLNILELAASPPDMAEGKHPDAQLIAKARTAYKDFVEAVVAKGVSEPDRRTRWLAGHEGRIIRLALDEPSKWLGYSTWQPMEKALESLERGLEPDDWERVARGALIRLDVIKRVKLKRGKGYTAEELKSFKKVMDSLFRPKGEHYGVDIVKAQTVLRWLADKGVGIDMNTFTEALNGIVVEVFS